MSGTHSSRSQTAICTWFVADSSEHATYFPQAVGRSDDKDVQNVYWRCSVCFFASSLLLNWDQPHIFFTNCRIPTVDGLDIDQVFRRWGVQVVQLPVTHRLSTGSVTRWGNQYYILDIIKYLADEEFARVIVLDSDCVWIKPVDDLEHAIEQCGVVTYTMGADFYKSDESINGLTQRQMADFLFQYSGLRTDVVAYHGGEIFAATHRELERLASQIEALWEVTSRGAPEAPKE